MKNIYFDKYLKQASTLPEQYVKKVEQQHSDEIKFFALSDLDSNLKLTQQWIVLGAKNLYSFESGLDEVIELKKIQQVRELRSKVANNLSLLDKEGNVLTVLWYGQRQNILFAQLKYLFELKIKGQQIDLEKTAQELYEKGSLAPIMKKQSGPEIEKKKVVWRLLSYIKPYRKEVLIGGIGAVGMTMVSLLPAYISGRMIDNTVRPFQDGAITIDEAMNMAWPVVGALGASYVLKEVFVWLRLKKMSIMGEKIARDLRRDIYSHLQTLEMDFFASKQTGSIISRVSSDTDRIWDFVAFGIVEVSIAVIMLVGLSSVLIGMDPLLGTIMTLPVPLMILAIFKHGQKMQRMFLRCWRKWSELTGVLSDTIPGIQVVKSFNQEQRETKRFNSKNEKAVDEFIGVHEAWTKFWPGLILSIHLVMMSVWVVALPRLISPETSSTHLSAGTFVSFLLYMTMFAQPIEIIGQMARMMNRATSSAYRIFEILDTPSSLKKTGNELKHNLKGEIEFKDVIFSYDGVRNVLKGLNFKIEQGEMIGLVGASGGGKSTITKLINRFYDVTSGQVLLDGIDLRSLEVGHLRKQVGVVHQDPYLFHGTIFENICYGAAHYKLEEVINAAKVANAHDFVLGFKDGYDTIVGERGQTLSGGERQRISIARAILNDPKLLILDEATSAVDTETERKIQDALDKLVQGRTVIAIAHRLSTLRKANRIFVVKKGEVVEVGTHSELMAIKGEYKKLQDMQTEMYQLMHGNEEVNNGV